MPYVKKKLTKERPDCPGKVILDRPQFLVMWKFKTRKPPKPKRWANLVVFMKDPTLRKRSFHVAIGWTGPANGLDALRLMDDHREVFDQVFEELELVKEKMVRQPSRDEDEEDEETWG